MRSAQIDETTWLRFLDNGLFALVQQDQIGTGNRIVYLTTADIEAISALVSAEGKKLERRVK